MVVDILIISTFNYEILSVSNTKGYKMKKTVINLTLGLALIGFTACATQPNILKEASKMPVVLHGEKHKIKNAEFITLIPAGTAIPFSIKVDGNVFMKRVEKTFPIRLKQDTYLYGVNNNDADIFNLWVSHDKKHWKTLNDTYKGSMALEVKVTHEKTAIDLGFVVNNEE